RRAPNRLISPIPFRGRLWVTPLRFQSTLMSVFCRRIGTRSTCSHCCGGGGSDGRTNRLLAESFEQRAQIDRRSCSSVRQGRNRAIMRGVDSPIDDRRRSFAARAPLALPSARAALADGATAAGSAQELPAIAGANSWIIAACDVA